MDNLIIESSWAQQIPKIIKSPDFLKIQEFLAEDKKKTEIYPPKKDIFNAFKYTPFDKVKVIILGQDPYHGKGQAHGLSFSVKTPKLPPSLKNIYKELSQDIGFTIPKSGDLTPWTQEGVLLLNSALTVRANQAGSHQKIGWDYFTDEVIKVLSLKKNHLVFLLWGSFAHSKEALIDQNKHLILKAPHPSPLSAYRGFFGCAHFSKTNEYLQKNGQDIINWSLED